MEIVPLRPALPTDFSEDGEWRARLVFSSWAEEQLLPWGLTPGSFGTVRLVLVWKAHVTGIVAPMLQT